MRYSSGGSRTLASLAGVLLSSCATVPQSDIPPLIDNDTRALHDRVLGYARKTAVGYVGEFRWSTRECDITVFSMMSSLGNPELRISLTNSRKGWGISYEDKDADGDVDNVRVWRLEGDRIHQLRYDGTAKDDIHFQGFVTEGLKRVPEDGLTSVLRYFVH